MKFPRTFHLPWTQGATKDDKILKNTHAFENKKLVYTEKLDGENTVMSKDKIHARSEDGYGKPWQTYMIRYWNVMKYDIPDDMYICGENLYAIHSIKYDKLPTCFFVFGIVLEDTYLPWESVKTWCELLGLDIVPTIYTGPIVNIPIPHESNFGPICEGYVARNIEAFQVKDFKDNVAKVVRACHVETDERWEDNWEKAQFLEDPIERLVAKRR